MSLTTWQSALMFPGVIRHVILPLHEALLRRSTFAILRRLQDQPRGHAQLLKIQRDGLRRLLEHAQREIPYWRDRLDGSLGRAEDGDPAAMLAAVPVLTRAEIRRNREAMRWAAAPGKVLMHSSSGTTDDNLSFYWGRGRQSWDRALRWRALNRHGVAVGERVLHLWPSHPASGLSSRLKGWLRVLRDELTNDVVIDLRPFTPDRLDAALARCAAYRPAVIIGYPSWLTALAERCRAVRPARRLPGLRLFLCMGEVLFDFQRRFLQETFDVPVFQEYGSQDAGLIAHEDPASVLRLNAEQMVVEVLCAGVPAPAGELGEVVVTHFHTEIMPFIRYATGDVVRQPSRPWSSPEEPGLPLFPLPEGRTSDLLLSTEQTLCPMRPVVEALVEQAGFWEFSLYQTRPGQVVFLEVQGERPAGRRAAAEEILRAFLGKQLRVEWQMGARFAPLRSAKRRFVCSPVALRFIAHDQESGLSLARAWPQLLEDTNGGFTPS